VLGDDDTCLWRVEAFEPGDDVARAGGIALVSEHRGDRLGVVGCGGAEQDRGLVGHVWMVPGSPSMRSRKGPWGGPPGWRRSGPNGPGRTDAGRRLGASDERAHVTSGPSPWRASAAARRPSVRGSRIASPAPPGRVPFAMRHRAPRTIESGAHRNSATENPSSLASSVAARSRSTVAQPSATTVCWLGPPASAPRTRSRAPVPVTRGACRDRTTPPAGSRNVDRRRWRPSCRRRPRGKRTRCRRRAPRTRPSA